MDAAEPEFGRPVGSVPLLQLQSLLESAVRGTSAAADPAAAKLAACFDHRSILNMLIANQQALAAAPGGDAAGGPKTPFSKVGVVAGQVGRRRAGRCSGRCSALQALTRPLPPPLPPQLKPATPAPMTASERSNIGRKRNARESFMLSYEVRRGGRALGRGAAGAIVASAAHMHANHPLRPPLRPA